MDWGHLYWAGFLITAAVEVVLSLYFWSISYSRGISVLGIIADVAIWPVTWLVWAYRINL